MLLVGTMLFTLDGFEFWFWCAFAISIAASSMMIYYYHFRKLKTLFWVAIVSLVPMIALELALWTILSGRREMIPFYILSTFGVIVAGIVYSLAMIFSEGSKKIWLKRAGIYHLPISCGLLILVIVNVTTSNIALRAQLDLWSQWLSLLGSLFPLFLLLNFVDELKKKHDDKIVPAYVMMSLIGFCFIGYSFFIVSGFTLVSSSKTQLYWQKKNAEETRKFVSLGEERVFTNGKGDTLKYLLVKPAEYKPEQQYPLVVALPYHGYEAPASQLLATESNRSRYSAFLFVPFCPEGAGWGGIPGYPTIDNLVFDAMSALEKEVNIDTTRRYVTGVSRGGYGSWHFITTRPDLFAAAVPVCGGGDPELGSRAVNVSVWAFHGALDKNVPVSGSRDMINAIATAGGNPKYTEFPDKAHNIWYEVTQTPGLLDWLFEQRQKSN